MKKVLLLLPHGFETYEACVFIDVIGWNLVDGDQTTKLFTCGLTKEVVSSFDQKFVVDYLIKEVKAEDFDALAVPGGFEEYDFYREAYSVDVQELIQQFYKQNKPIASICVGALLLGQAGILKGKKATTYNQKPIRQQLLGTYGADVINEPIVVDNNIITSWNPSTAIFVALLLLEMLTSKANAGYIAKIMGFDERMKVYYA
ncbi:MAG TPA: DJ-1/PfpI family protein [Bacteroidales bacterium]|mgnify:CR=1 FL=1|nr:DJ-1/PfpI family protein [Bacteroidales bacterium]